MNTLPIFAITYPQKDTPSNQLAEKYCDSLGKNLFTGLDKESILKYEYFFSVIPENSIKDQNKFLKEFKSDVEYICSYEISNSNEKEFNLFLKIILKIKVILQKSKLKPQIQHLQILQLSQY